MDHNADQSLNDSDNPSPLSDNNLDMALGAILYQYDCPDKMVLGDYHLDLLSEADQVLIRQHLDHCPHCREALARLDEFLVIDDLPVGEDLPIEATSGLSPDPGWQERIFDYGRAWLEQETGRWRQIAVALSNLGQAGSTAPALAGLMSETVQATPAGQESLTIAPTEAGFELEVMITPDPAGGEAGFCRLEVALSLTDRFGDFSGAQVTLLWGDTVQNQETNTLGEVAFDRLPCHQLAMMNLLVRLPGTNQ